MGKTPRRWTEEEWQYVVENYRIKTIDEIATHIKRHKNVIQTKIKREGLLVQYRDLPPIAQDDGTYLIPLNVKHGRERQYAIVDAESVDVVKRYRWNLHKGRNTNYAYAKIGPRKQPKSFGMHYLIMQPPEEMEVDHKNRNGLDNRKSNLRIGTKTQNRANTPITRKTQQKTSKYKGVSRIPATNKWKNPRELWKAMLQKKLLGNFESEIEAAKAYDKAAKEAYGEFAYLNFPDES